MKKISLIYVLLMLTVTAIASSGIPYDTAHTPRDGDRLHPGLDDSGRLIISITDSARTVLLNPAEVSFGKGRDACLYIDGDTVSYVQSATRHRFMLRGDTLSYVGYENRASDFRLDRPARVATFPLGDGASVEDGWNGHLIHYGSMALKHVRGVSRSSVEKEWTLTDGTDTLRNAARLLWTLDMAYADADSITPEMPDSVASEIISEMQVDVRAVLSERLLTERALWFAEDARYPVLSDTRVSRVILNESGAPVDTVPVSMLAMYCPPSWQRSDTGEDITVRQPDGTDGGNACDPYGDRSPDSGSVLSVGEPEVSGGFVNVTLSSRSEPMSAAVTLFSDSGVRLTEPVTVTVGAVPQVHSIGVPSGWSGVMLLRVEAEGESYTRKTVK